MILDYINIPKEQFETIYINIKKLWPGINTDWVLETIGYSPHTCKGIIKQHKDGLFFLICPRERKNCTFPSMCPLNMGYDCAELDKHYKERQPKSQGRDEIWCPVCNNNQAITEVCIYCGNKIGETDE